MSSLRAWVVACAIIVLGVLVGVPWPVVALAAAPFAVWAGWHLADPPRRPE